MRELAPALVFLDVQMPVLDGFEVMTEVGVERMPAVIFVTAYDEYALRAFDVHALDYLLKPFERSRFERAVARAKEELAGGTDDEKLARRLRALLKEVGPTRDGEDRLVIKSHGRITLLRPEELVWIEAAGNYVRLHVEEGAHLMRETMTSILERLPPGEFLRVSRSAIIRLDRIRELRRRQHGEYLVVLRDGTSVKSSRAYADGLRRVLEE